MFYIAKQQYNSKIPGNRININIVSHYCPIKKGNSIFETVEL